MRNEQFPIRKGGIFCPGQEIKGLRGGVHRYAAQADPKIDAAWAKKNPFRTETTFINGLPQREAICFCRTNGERFIFKGMAE
jgi:hypothetical protein